ncbi:MAG: response regulator [Methyloligellaceae bacterium]
MHPFFYPTTTIIIDDDQELLDSLNYNLGDNTLCKSFNNVEKATRHIDSVGTEKLEIGNFFSAHSNAHDMDANDQGDLFIKIRSTYWFNILQSPERFDEISVAIVDYSMPAKDGIELCRELKNHPMKKIMLTGQADQAIAIEAFNEKIIDNFILKQDAADNIDKLREVIKKHTNEYIADKTQSFKLAFSLQEARFLTHAVFQLLFEEHRNQQDIVEYYVNSQPPGVLMFNAAGRPSLMIVYETERMRAHYEIAEEYGAPPALLSALANNEVLPLFPTDTGYYNPIHARDWQQHIYPAQKIDDEKPLYFAKLQNADFVLKHLNRYISLKSYKQLSQTFSS